MTAKRTRSAFRLAALLVAAASVGVLGCGKKTATITGTVTYNNKPVTSGEVIFLSQDGHASAHAPIHADGSFTVTNAPVGPVQVAVDNPPPTKVQVTSKNGNDPEVREARQQAAHYVATPLKYRDPKQSGLHFDARPGSNEYDITLP
jgi:hypothetical protein